MAKTFSITKPLGGDRRGTLCQSEAQAAASPAVSRAQFRRSTPCHHSAALEYLASEGISAERKSIYSDLEALQSFGLDLIRVRDGNLTCWYIGERVFQLPELRLLADSVQSSRFITRKSRWS